MGQFVEDKEEWPQYAEIVDMDIVANRVKGVEKKRVVLSL